ncbi:hypothetical protein GCM10020331_018730 [Ectobacillus funiculus]
MRHHLVFCQVYDAFIASEVKLTLMEMLPDEYEVYIVTAAGTSFESLKKVPLHELDHEAELNNLTSVYVPPVKEKNLYCINSLTCCAALLQSSVAQMAVRGIRSKRMFR